MQINYLAVIIATVLQFICGALWYTALFGKLWGKIHDFHKHSKEEQEKMMKSMGPFYGLQFAVTLLMTYVLALFESQLPAPWHAFGIAGFAWLGFVLPTTISGVIFGGTPPQWIVKKIAVQAGCSLVCMQVAAAVLYFM